MNTLFQRTKLSAPLSVLLGLSVAVCAGLAAAQETAAPSPAELAAEQAEAPEPPVRPQVPFRSNTDEVVVYGRRDPLDLPDSVRSQIWRDERQQMRAMMLERERMSSELAKDGFDALVGGKNVALLPAYNPADERQIDYGVNDGTPAGVINLIGVGFGRKKKD